MNIGELFVSLGIKGSEKTIGALTNVKKGLSDTASMSLEAKAGIMAAMYALERLFASSNHTGTGLTNFTAAIGVSAKTLQQYQFAARQMGVANQEVEGSFKSLQSAMVKTLMGEGAPKGMERVARMTGGISAQDIERFARQPELLMQKLQEYASKETNAGLRNEVLKSFGIGDNMVAAMVRGAFRPDVLKKAPIYSDKEIGALDKANIAWSNLGNKIEMAIGHFNAKHGLQLVTDISHITDKVIKMSEAFMKLSSNLHVFDGIGKIFEGWGKIFDSINKALELLGKGPEGRKELKEDVTGFFKEMPNVMGAIFDDIKGAMGIPNAAPAGGIPADMFAPPMNSTPMPSNQNFNFNQNLNFQHEGKDATRVGDSVTKANRDAIKQFVQGQAS